MSRRSLADDIRKGLVWTHGSDEEIWNCEECFRTKREALSAARASESLYVGRMRVLGIDDFSPRLMADLFIEQMGEQAVAVVGEACEDWPEGDLADDLTPIMAMAVSKVLTGSRAMVEITHIEEIAFEPVESPAKGGER